MLFDEKSAIKKTQHIDKIVCAEIPNPKTSPKLHKLVAKFMMRQPTAKRCHVKMNKSKFHQYPKEFTSKTTLQKQNEPVYRRRSPENGGFKANVLINSETQVKMLLDNRWVVPYNAFLLTKYKTYIRMEVRSSLIAKDFLEFLNDVCEKKTKEIWHSSTAKANKFVEMCGQSDKKSKEYPFEV